MAIKKRKGPPKPTQKIKKLTRAQQKERQKRLEGKSADKKRMSAIAQINKMGYSFSTKKMMFVFGVYSAICILTGIVMDLQILYMLMLIAVGLLFMPKILVRTYRNRLEQSRYDDATMYMEQILYSFRVHHTILDSLHDMETQFPEGTLHDDIMAAEEHILSAPSTEPNVVHNALGIIEQDYYCPKLVTIHRFMEKVEQQGGRFDSVVRILLSDLSAWELRQIEIQRRRHEKHTNVVLSIVIAVVLCVIFMKSLPEQYDISQNRLVQMASVVMWAAMFMLYDKADKAASVNLLDTNNDMDENKARNKYNKIVYWNEQEQFFKSVKYALFVVGFTLLILLMSKKLIVLAIGLGLAGAMLFQHKLDFRLTTKSLIEEIHLAFPRWIISMSLLLQSDSVQVALVKSYEDAPSVLKPEIELLIERLNKAPEDINPFLDFLNMFQLKDVQAAMKMLYSIQMGSGGDAEAQIADIIERNNKMLEVTEMKLADKQMAKLAGMFMAPLIIAAGKLVVDMMVFLMMAFASMS